MTWISLQLASAASGGSSINPHEGSKDEEGADDDAALETQRKHRRDMKNNTNNKLDRLVDVAARLEFVEEALAKVADGKAPEDTLLTRSEWEVLKQQSAEKGQKAQEETEREYDSGKKSKEGPTRASKT